MSGGGYGSVREMFEKQPVPLGMLCGCIDPAIPEILGYCGFDFILFDNEHAPIEPANVAGLIRAAEISGLLPLVRTVENDRALISKMVDAGARGIVLTHVGSAAEVREAVDALRFAPVGSRGWCSSNRAAKFSVPYWSRYSAERTESIAIIPLIESMEGIDNIDEIFAVPEVECAFFGPGDLSHELGVHGEGIRSGLVQDAARKLIAAGKRANKKVIGYPFPEKTVEMARACLDMGFDAICYGSDLPHFADLFAGVAAQFGRSPRW